MTPRALLVLLFPTALTAQTRTADSVRALDSAWARSYAVHDTALALNLFAPDIVVTGLNGTIKNRDGEVRDIRPAPNLLMHYFRTKDVNVGVHGNSAVTTGTAEWRFDFNGRTSDFTIWYAALYQRGGPLGWAMKVLLLRRPPAPVGHAAHQHPAGANILMRGTIGGAENAQPDLFSADSTVYLLSPRSTAGPQLKALRGQPVRVVGTVYPAGGAYLIVVDSVAVTTP